MKTKYYTILFYGDGYSFEYLGEFENFTNAQSAAWLKSTAKLNVISESLLKDMIKTINQMLAKS